LDGSGEIGAQEHDPQPAVLPRSEASDEVQARLGPTALDEEDGLDSRVS
jgi:hypothetical protein